MITKAECGASTATTTLLPTTIGTAHFEIDKCEHLKVEMIQLYSTVIIEPVPMFRQYLQDIAA
jgi:hypothetical protein